MKWQNSIRDCVIHNFYCSVCKNKGIPIARVKTSLRPRSHKKHLYCVHCKRVTNHIETRFCEKEKL